MNQGGGRGAEGGLWGTDYGMLKTRKGRRGRGGERRREKEGGGGGARRRRRDHVWIEKTCVTLIFNLPVGAQLNLLGNNTSRQQGFCVPSNP